MSRNQTFTGSGNFTGTGNGQANTVTGGAGNDILDGGAGADTLIGGTGNDVFIADNASDTITEASNAGIDTVQTLLFLLHLGDQSMSAPFTGVGSFAGTGNTADNIIRASSGSDTLLGNNGNDTLIGGAGNDCLTGGKGDDNFVFAPGFGRDTISDFDFNPAGGGQDLLDISAFGITSATFGSRVGLTDLGTDIQVTIDGDANQAITLVNAQLVSNITQTDFIL